MEFSYDGMTPVVHYCDHGNELLGFHIRSSNWVTSGLKNGYTICQHFFGVHNLLRVVMQ